MRCLIPCPCWLLSRWWLFRPSAVKNALSQPSMSHMTSCCSVVSIACSGTICCLYACGGCQVVAKKALRVIETSILRKTSLSSAGRKRSHTLRCCWRPRVVNDLSVAVSVNVLMSLLSCFSKGSASLLSLLWSCSFSAGVDMGWSVAASCVSRICLAKKGCYEVLVAAWRVHDFLKTIEGGGRPTQLLSAATASNATPRGLSFYALFPHQGAPRPHTSLHGAFCLYKRPNI